jgi:ComEC/Rec2-related protein
MIYKNASLLALGFIAGIILSFYTTLPLFLVVLLAVSGAGATGFIIYKEYQWKELPFIFSIAAMLAISVPLGNLRMHMASSVTDEGTAWHYMNVENKYQKEYKLRGVIDAEPELRHYGTIDIQFKIDEIYDNETKSWIDFKDANILLKVLKAGDTESEFYLELADSDAYGYELEITADKKYLPPQKNPETFDYGSYLTQINMIGLFETSIENITVTNKSSGSIFNEWAFALKNSFLSTYKKTIKSPSSRLVSGATLGTRRALDGVKYGNFEIPEAFRRAGVGHVLAVSGLHVSIVSLLLYSIFVMAGFKPSRFAPVIILLLFLFTLLTGARPSTMRAAIMNSVTLIAFAYFRYNLRKATFIGLSVSSLVILILNPHVLFSASFLLSFGAVLSLVIITPTLSGWLNELRGFTLIFVTLYLIGIIYLANTDISLFMKTSPLLTMGALLWILVRLGRILNDRIPFMWQVAYNKLPFAIRSLIVAQFAIQFGMMIPLNAWFFGQFPVSGIIVNMLAIPLIGVIVQLGILTGLAGLIPVVGSYVAMPLGAFSHIMAQFFLWIADMGATYFNYPATPKPSPEWMALYYLAVVLVLSYDKILPFIQTFLYKFNSKLRSAYFRYLPAGFAALFLIIPLIINAVQIVKPETMIVYHDWKTPAVSLSFSNRKAVAFNGGTSYFTDRILFSGIRYSKAASLQGFVLPRVYEKEIQSIDRFSEKVSIESIFVPKGLQEESEKLSTDSNGTQMRLIPIRPVSFFNLTETVSFSFLSPDKSEYSRPIIIEVYDKKILFITDYTEKDLPESDIGKEYKFDIMISPHIDDWRDYYYVVDVARKAEPKVLIVSNGRRSGKISAMNIPKKLERDFPVLLTDKDGAVIINFENEKLIISTMLNDKSIELE